MAHHYSVTNRLADVVIYRVFPRLTRSHSSSPIWLLSALLNFRDGRYSQFKLREQQARNIQPLTLWNVALYGTFQVAVDAQFVVVILLCANAVCYR